MRKLKLYHAEVIGQEKRVIGTVLVAADHFRQAENIAAEWVASKHPHQVIKQVRITKSKKGEVIADDKSTS